MILCKEHTMNALCGVHGCLVGKLCSTLLWSHGLQPARLLCPRDFPGKNPRVGCISYSRRSLGPSDQTLASCTGRQTLYHWSSGKPINSGLVKTVPLLSDQLNKGKHRDLRYSCLFLLFNICTYLLSTIKKRKTSIFFYCN